MRNSCAMALVGVFCFFSGCATYSANYADSDEQVDLYLSTLDDKHFVWCELDLEQCRKDFEEWKITPRGRVIIKEYEKEKAGQTYNTHPVPNVFRTYFVDESQFIEQDGKMSQKETAESLKIFGPEIPSRVRNHVGTHESP